MIEVDDAVTFEEQLEALLREGARLHHKCDSAAWRRDFSRLVARARKLAAQHADRAAAHYVVGRLRWLDVYRELRRPRPLALAPLRRALAVDPAYLPATQLACNVLTYYGGFGPRPRLIAAAVTLAEAVARRTEWHPGAAAQLRAVRDLRRRCDYDDPLPWSPLPWLPGERESCREMEAAIARQEWDGIHVDALPLG